ncbi:hypothetical protein VM98_36515, partial [Streptomyces rubellomurinus subsp. indigoferus]
FPSALAPSAGPDAPRAAGGVRWSRAEARWLAAAQPALAAGLRRRDGQVPLLRRPFGGGGEAATGYDSVGVLPRRDAAAEDLSRRLLGGIDDALLLTRPGLAEVVVETPEGV